jgi:hypothetical protein
MVDISTGYFVMVTGGSFLFGALVTVVLFKLFGLKLPIKQSAKDDDDLRGVEPLQETLYEKDTDISQAYLRVPPEQLKNAERFVRGFGGYTIKRIPEKRGESDKPYLYILHVSVPRERRKDFQEAVRKSRDYISSAYSNRGYALKTEKLTFREPSD